eukprot:CAMPEP_0183342370 /NCGR_PEP_ID=MMETSP0164_2-20130417/8486_1 /TAXON_ID=221442 /ORGANISM="Coccolithus pelagicus ssp braarudi, Strain PLY182g" /LENGTH=65 /DNA_ID=CAMNT_0025512929 /DNA_START=126 /DNA_END=323 /DNA_ORIENTATION=+
MPPHPTTKEGLTRRAFGSVALVYKSSERSSAGETQDTTPGSSLPGLSIVMQLETQKCFPALLRSE